MNIEDKQINDFRHMLVGQQIRICQLALSLHKEQERIDNLISVIDSWMINKGE